MRTLLLSFDRKAFEEGSPSRERFAAYGKACEETHVIVYALARLGLEPLQIAENVWLYPTNSASRLRYLTDAARIAKERFVMDGVMRMDVISAQDPCETGLPAWLLARKYRVPLQLQDHIDVFNPAFLREHPLNLLRALTALFLLPRADGIRTVSPASTARLARVLPSVAGRLAMLPVYVDLARFRDAQPAFSLAERYPGFDSFIVMASRFVPQKDLPLALAAFERVCAARPRACLILIGEGPQQRMLDARAQELAPNVIVLRWQADLAAYYHQADVFLLTSHYESYGRTLVEAAACRLPFVSSDVGVAGALAAEGAVGIVCRSRSAEAYADALLRILDRERGADTERSIDAAFRLNSASLEEYLARYRDLLERCIACARRRTPA